MEFIITFLIVGAIIQSFLHCAHGTIHVYEKLFGGLYSICFVGLTIYSIIKYGIKCLLIMPLVFYISNLLFTIIFEKLFRYTLYKRNNSTKNDDLNFKELLKKTVNDIYNKNYTYEFINGGYSYSSELTDIFILLNNKKYKKIYDDNISNYNKKALKALDKKDPFTFTLEECIIYLNYLWHLEGTGLASGIILKRLEDNRYIFTLGKLSSLIE